MTLQLPAVRLDEQETMPGLVQAKSPQPPPPPTVATTAATSAPRSAPPAQAPPSQAPPSRRSKSTSSDDLDFDRDDDDVTSSPAIFGQDRTMTAIFNFRRNSCGGSNNVECCNNHNNNNNNDTNSNNNNNVEDCDDDDDEGTMLMTDADSNLDNGQASHNGRGNNDEGQIVSGDGEAPHEDDLSPIGDSHSSDNNNVTLAETEGNGVSSSNIILSGKSRFDISSSSSNAGLDANENALKGLQQPLSETHTTDADSNLEPRDSSPASRRNEQGGVSCFETRESESGENGINAERSLNSCTGVHVTALTEISNSDNGEPVLRGVNEGGSSSTNNNTKTCDNGDWSEEDGAIASAEESTKLNALGISSSAPQKELEEYANECSTAVSTTESLVERKSSPHSESQRQRSLGPESSSGTEELSAKCMAARKQLQRSSSYPQVKPKILFTPIRPSPEESGLFRGDVHEATALRSEEEVNEREAQTTADSSECDCRAVQQSSQPSGEHTGKQDITGNSISSSSIKVNNNSHHYYHHHHHHHHQSNLPVARVNPQQNNLNIPPVQQQLQQQQQQQQQQIRKSTDSVITKQAPEEQRQISNNNNNNNNNINVPQNHHQQASVKPCTSVFNHHHVYPTAPSSFVMADGSVVFQHGGYPFMLMPGPAGSYYMSRDFPPDHSVALQAMSVNPMSHPHHHPHSHPQHQQLNPLNSKFLSSPSPSPVPNSNSSSLTFEKAKGVHAKKDVAPCAIVSGESPSSSNSPSLDLTTASSSSYSTPCSSQLVDVTVASSTSISVPNSVIESNGSTLGMEPTTTAATSNIKTPAAIMDRQQKAQKANTLGGGSGGGDIGNMGTATTSATATTQTTSLVVEAAAAMTTTTATPSLTLPPKDVGNGRRCHPSSSSSTNTTTTTSSSGGTVSNGKRRKHRQPLLPDPDVPRFSELAANMSFPSQQQGALPPSAIMGLPSYQGQYSNNNNHSHLHQHQHQHQQQQPPTLHPPPPHPPHVIYPNHNPGNHNNININNINPNHHLHNFNNSNNVNHHPPHVFQGPSNAPPPPPHVFLHHVPAAAPTPQTPPSISSHPSTPSPGGFSNAKSPGSSVSKTSDLGSSHGSSSHKSSTSSSSSASSSSSHTPKTSLTGSSNNASSTTSTSSPTDRALSPSSSTKSYVASPTSVVECVSDASGLVIFGPQPPFVERGDPQSAQQHQQHQQHQQQQTQQQTQSTMPMAGVGVGVNMGVGISGLPVDASSTKCVDGSEPEEVKAYNNGVAVVGVAGGVGGGGPAMNSMPIGGPPASVVYLQDASGALVAVNAALLQQTLNVDMTSLPGVYPRTDNSSSYPLMSPAPGAHGGMEAAGGTDAGASAPMDANSPAMVRMVSSNGPPAPLPMQVPPGHMVQQIVDENGVLTHVILSSQPPGPGNPMSVGPYGGPANGSQYYTSYEGPYPPTPPQYGHHSHSVPPHMHGGGMPHIQPSNNPACNNHAPVPGPGASPPLNSTDERTLRTRNRVRKKLQQRRSNADSYYANPPRSQGGRRNRAGGVNGDSSGGMHGDMGMGHGQCGTPENGPMDPEEENTLITQYLSTMPIPKVTDVESRKTLIQLSPLDCDQMDLELHASELKYELLLSDKGREAKYKPVFYGHATEITLRDLKPATEYHLKVCAVLNDELRGTVTEPVSFRTPPCEPDKPQPPKPMTKTRTSISLKWNATCDNGSKITSYILECDQGSGDGTFHEVYNGTTRQFRVSGLNASTRYVFRLAAQNTLGMSHYSDCVGFLTSGSVPSQPDPPMLSEQFVYALTISWIRRPNDEEFLLQMEDDTTGHGFIPVYNGPNLSYKVGSLRRNAEYRFRLCARNEEGQSKWSETVLFRTRPDCPLHPSKPQIKGKILSHSFRITWDPPSDSGGAEITKYIVELDDGQGYDVVYEGSAREHPFDQLIPGHTYRVRVACCSIGGRSDFSDFCVATTLPVVPGQCQAPKLQGKPKATSLHLRWGYPDYDGGSQVTSFAAQMISPDNSSREVYKGHDLDCIVAGLLPGRPYLFQIRAFNRTGAGPWSDPLEVISGAGVPDTPRAPQVACRSPHSALLTWDEPFNNGANITEYRLEWQQKSEAADFAQLHVGPNLSFDAKGLLPATFYSFRVQAINSAGPGPFSPPSPCVTPPSSPAPIVSIKAQARATCALLTWREPHSNGSDITSFNIDVSDRPLISVDPVTEYLLEELSPETTYKIRVQAVNSIGVGAFSTAVKLTTKALPPAPPRLECLLIGPSSIKLKWGEGRNPDLLTYTLEMEKEDGSFQPVYTGPAHNHKVNRLSELTCYEFRIFASNEAGRGAYSDTYSFTTTKTPPPAPKAPKAQSNSPHSCTLEWQTLKPMGDDSVHYILQTICSGRDNEYKLAYRGPNNTYHLDNLSPHAEYQARVAAVRVSSDGGDITGTFSPCAVFSPLTPEPQRGCGAGGDSGAAGGSSRDRQAAEHKPWTDNEQAVVILLAFAIATIVIAFLCQHLVIYQPDAVDDAAAAAAASSSYQSSSSPPPSSSS